MSPVLASLAALQLVDHGVVYGGAAVGDVEQDVDLLHVLHQAPGDGRVLRLLVRPVDDPGVNVLLLDGGGEGEEEGDLEQEGEEEYVDHGGEVLVVSCCRDDWRFNKSRGGSPAHSELWSKYFQ